MRNGNVRMPREASQLSNGFAFTPYRLDRARILRVNPEGPTTTPAMTSPWPFRYLDTLCHTSVAPCSIGRIRLGVPNVLSTSSGTCPNDATIIGRSATSKRGLEIDSTMHNFVCG